MGHVRPGPRGTGMAGPVLSRVGGLLLELPQGTSSETYQTLTLD